jgi:hypothetical protein
LVAFHPPEVKIAACEQGKAAHREGRAAPMGGGREEGGQSHGCCHGKRRYIF